MRAVEISEKGWQAQHKKKRENMLATLRQLQQIVARQTERSRQGGVAARESLWAAAELLI